MVNDFLKELYVNARVPQWLCLRNHSSTIDKYSLSMGYTSIYLVLYIKNTHDTRFFAEFTE